MKKTLIAAAAAFFLFMGPDHAYACVKSSKQKPMSDKYWEAVASCESRNNWRDGGRYAGGLGIAITTWRGYGGYMFAKSPDRATKEQQIIVANRISVFGFQTKHEYLTLEDRLNNKPFFRPAVGFRGWGCIRHNKWLHPSRWPKKKGYKCQNSSLQQQQVTQQPSM